MCGQGVVVEKNWALSVDQYLAYEIASRRTKVKSHSKIL